MGKSLHWALVAIRSVLQFLLVAWGTLAIYFSNLPWAWMRLMLARAFAGALLCVVACSGAVSRLPIARRIGSSARRWSSIAGANCDRLAMQAIIRGDQR